MKPQFCCAVAITAIVSQAALAQARVTSAPPEPSLLNITRQWSGASSLGDLRELRTGADHLELRVWAGFGLKTQTQAVVLRRSAGQWTAFLARVLRCEIQIPRSVGDTASRETMQRYVVEARRRCGTPVTDVRAGAQILATDSLVVEKLMVSDSTIESAWTGAVRAGALQLPGRVERNVLVDDVFTYVVEVRRGGEYRASVVEHVAGSMIEVDRQMNAVYAAVSRVLNPQQILNP
jgi:hypothetical protein